MSSPIAAMTATPFSISSAKPEHAPSLSRRLVRRSIDPEIYRQRNLVERFFNKLKHFRAVATRYEKHDANYLALVKLASARIWMRFMSR